MAHHITKVIGTDTFWQVNKHLAHHIGLHATLLLNHMLSLQSKVFGNKEFFQTTKDFVTVLPLSKHQVQQAIKQLQEYGLITRERKLHNNKNWYFVLENRIQEVLETPLGEKLSMYMNTQHMDNNSSSTRSKANQVDEQDFTKYLDKSYSSHIEKKIIRKEDIKKEVNKKKAIAYNTSGNEGNIIAKTIIEVLLNPNSKLEDYNNAVKEYNEYGIDKISEMLKWDSSVKNNHIKQISNINAIR